MRRGETQLNDNTSSTPCRLNEHLERMSAENLCVHGVYGTGDAQYREAITCR